MNFVKWLSTPQAKIVAAATKEKALAEFKERFPKGVQSLSPLQGDLAFNQTNNKYDIPSYRRNLRVSILLTRADPGRTKETLDSLETNG